MKCYPFNPKITKKDLEQGQAVSNAFWNACSMALINEKENKMAKTKYDIGDILTWCDDGDYYATVVVVRWHTKDIYVEGISLERQTDYDMFIKPKGDDFRFIRGVPEIVLLKYKVVGHIDISGMPIDEVKTHLDRATKMTCYDHGIYHPIEAYWTIMKLCEPKETNEYVKKESYIPKIDDSFCCYSLADKLKEECKQKQKHLDLANNKIFELKKEVDSLREALHDDLARIHNNLSKMGFTEDAICSIMYSEFNYMLGTE
jgi:hypothetical protein